MRLPSLFGATFAALFCARMFAQEIVPLISATDPGAAWTFNNGQEFPGTTGALTIDAEAKRDGRASLKLSGPATAIYILIGKTAEKKQVDLWLNDVSILPRATAAGTAPFKSAEPIALSRTLEMWSGPRRRRRRLSRSRRENGKLRGGRREHVVVLPALSRCGREVARKLR